MASRRKSNLHRRISDYNHMVSQKTIGNGARGSEGYQKPGSNKK